jgi:hypothetical protein
VLQEQVLLRLWIDTIQLYSVHLLSHGQVFKFYMNHESNKQSFLKESLLIKKAMALNNIKKETMAFTCASFYS